MTDRAAIYARFSTEKQRDASIEDQVRECERVATAAGLRVVARFEDRGLSGGTHQRPGYQALLTAARAGRFDIIVTEDISRLWRSRAEFGPRSAELEDLGVHWLSCVGQDTRRDGWGLVIQVLQAMAEQARREASYRTRRGLAGRAHAGQPTGGRPYGYVPARDSDSGQIEIDDAQAPVVRRIFELYAAGMSPRSIAAKLNSEEVPAPGASWKRTRRRKDAKWIATAIHGDQRKGYGILNNARYTGLISWGKSEWRRSAADSSIRRPRMLGADAAIQHTEERLRIIPQDLWDRVKARQAAQTRDLGVRVKSGLRKRAGVSPYMLSGALRCDACGSAFAMSNAVRYQCASHCGGGDHACAVHLSVPRQRLEREVLAFMLSPELPRHLELLEARWAATEPVTVDHRARIAELERQRDNLIGAIKRAGLAAELGGELKAITTELKGLEALQAATQAGAGTKAPRARVTVQDRLKRTLERLDAGGELAQAAVREIFPAGIWLYADPDGGRFLRAYAQTRLEYPAGLLDADGRSAAAGFPRVYNTLARTQAPENERVSGSGSGGRI